eukprot:8317236-Alexandrium_andersonii.AAC.1
MPMQEELQLLQGEAAQDEPPRRAHEPSPLHMQVESRLVLPRGASAEARPRPGLPGLPQAA